ncbi:hypothetical protein BDQ17DRAFT_1334326 [Cyathus striatus]|nr:hypothetical protein BDQ17DRAFT_1334326 [Cyathus striatus]
MRPPPSFHTTTTILPHCLCHSTPTPPSCLGSCHRAPFRTCTTHALIDRATSYSTWLDTCVVDIMTLRYCVNMHTVPSPPPFPPTPPPTTMPIHDTPLNPPLLVLSRVILLQHEMSLMPVTTVPQPFHPHSAICHLPSPKLTAARSSFPNPNAPSRSPAHNPSCRLINATLSIVPTCFVVFVAGSSSTRCTKPPMPSTPPSHYNGVYSPSPSLPSSTTLVPVDFSMPHQLYIFPLPRLSVCMHAHASGVRGEKIQGRLEHLHIDVFTYVSPFPRLSLGRKCAQSGVDTTAEPAAKKPSIAADEETVDNIAKQENKSSGRGRGGKKRGRGGCKTAGDKDKEDEAASSAANKEKSKVQPKTAGASKITGDSEMTGTHKITVPSEMTGTSEITGASEMTGTSGVLATTPSQSSNSEDNNSELEHPNSALVSDAVPTKEDLKGASRTIGGIFQG